MVSLNEVLGRFGPQDMDEGFFDSWEMLMPSMPRADHLSEEHLRRIGLELLELPELYLGALLDAAHEISHDEALTALLWYCWEVSCGRAPEFYTDLPRVKKLPVLTKGVRPLTAELFGLVLHVSGLETVRGRYASRSIPEHYLKAVYADVRLWMERLHALSGKITFDKADWMIHHATGNLFRIGRLQYEFARMGSHTLVLKHRTSGEVIALSGDGIPYRQNGLVDGTDDVYEENPWISALDIAPDSITGHPISRLGYATREPKTYSRAEYDIALKENDWTLSLHIPPGERLGKTDCAESLEQARAFMSSYFPEFDFRAFTCHSWLFDSQLADILGPESNITQFQSLFHMTPVRRADGPMKVFVYGDPKTDILATQPKTSLHRAVKAFYEQGGRLHTGRAFLLR